MEQEQNNSRINDTDVNSADANNTYVNNQIVNSTDANNTDIGNQIVYSTDTNNTDISDPIVNNTDTNDQCEKTGKQKFFSILKLVMAILLFIPAMYIVGMGIVLIFFLLMGATSAQPGSTSDYMATINQIWIVSIIPLILVIILFAKVLKSTIKSFVKIDNKKLGLNINKFLIIFNIVLFFIMWIFYEHKSITLLAISIILLIIYMYKKGK